MLSQCIALTKNPRHPPPQFFRLRRAISLLVSVVVHTGRLPPGQPRRRDFLHLTHFVFITYITNAMGYLRLIMYKYELLNRSFHSNILQVQR